MKKNSPSTIGTSCGRRAAHWSISPSVNSPRFAAAMRSSRRIAHIASIRSGVATRLATRGIAWRVAVTVGCCAVSPIENLLRSLNMAEEAATAKDAVKQKNWTLA